MCLSAGYDEMRLDCTAFVAITREGAPRLAGSDLVMFARLHCIHR